jgi:hypothetical protein
VNLPEPVLIDDAGEFLEAEDTEYDIVDLSDLKGFEGKSIRVRSLTGKERGQYDQSVTVQHPGGKVTANVLNARAKLVALASIKADGERLFTDKQAQDLGEKNAKALGRIADKILDLSGMLEESEEEAKEDFTQDPSSELSSESPPSSDVPSGSF